MHLTLAVRSMVSTPQLYIAVTQTPFSFTKSNHISPTYKLHVYCTMYNTVACLIRKLKISSIIISIEWWRLSLFVQLNGNSSVLKRSSCTSNEHWRSLNCETKKKNNNINLAACRAIVESNNKQCHYFIPNYWRAHKF